ncbi:hypothetical protein [Chitinophaga pinensis]|uniref:Uncharacterized protein n=1 Tax=Chitinophaga pinensis TaxID=79329 RepID=A0A5C6LQS9_9BACT|nr:hypothetical protein [Chitinophaga pinensis]TWV95689.1 hypothetical protein FEF09_23945 [Chitinophaga pinensis]
MQEEVIAVLKGAGPDITTSKLKFVTGKGIVLESKDLGNGRYTVKVTGVPAAMHRKYMRLIRMEKVAI